MILKIVWKEGKSTIIDDIDDIDFIRHCRDEFPEELNYEGSTSSKYIYEVRIHKRDGNIINKNISSKFYIMNDDGKTIEIIHP